MYTSGRIRWKWKLDRDHMCTGLCRYCDSCERGRVRYSYGSCSKQYRSSGSSHWEGREPCWNRLYSRMGWYAGRTCRSQGRTWESWSDRKDNAGKCGRGNRTSEWCHRSTRSRLCIWYNEYSICKILRSRSGQWKGRPDRCRNFCNR